MRWAARDVLALLATLGLRGPGRQVLAIDGHGGSGKSTLAAAMVAAEPDATTIHTDDVAWHHSMFDWSAAMLDGVVRPFRDGQLVRYVPPGWVAKGRAGCLQVPSSTRLLIIEGTGAGRHELSPHVDALVWVEADLALARERGLARDLASGSNGATRAEAERFWDDWMAEETPFLGRHRPWERADAVVHGTPTIPLREGQIAVRKA